MKRFRLLNSDDGMIVDEVESRQCKFCSSAFTYKDENGYYHLIDEESGLSIVKAKQLIMLEQLYKNRKRQYEQYKKTDAYKIKCERFDKLKLIHNAKGVR